MLTSDVHMHAIISEVLFYYNNVLCILCRLWVIDKTGLYCQFYWRVNKYWKSLYFNSSQGNVCVIILVSFWFLYPY